MSTKESITIPRDTTGAQSGPADIAVYIRFPDQDAVPFGMQHTTLFRHILKRALTGNGLDESEPLCVLELSGRLLAIASVTDRAKALSIVKHELSDLGYLDCSRIGWLCRAEGYWRDHHNTEKISLPPLDQLIKALPTWSEEAKAQEDLRIKLVSELTAMRKIMAESMTPEQRTTALRQMLEASVAMLKNIYPL